MKNASIVGALVLGTCANPGPQQGIEHLIDLNNVDTVMGAHGVSFEERITDDILSPYHDKKLLLLVKQGNPLLAEHLNVSSYQYIDVVGYVTKKDTTSYRVVPVHRDEQDDITLTLEQNYSLPITFSN